MKFDLKKLSAVLFTILLFNSTIKAQVVNIPDVNFRNYLVSNFDSNHDGLIQTTEASTVTTSIYVSGLNISDLTGIEAFYNVKKLYCKNNNLSTLDISSNFRLTDLDCYNNNLSNLDISGNPDLVYLKCSYNNLTSINVSGNINLDYFDCGGNQLTSLNVSANALLGQLICENNQLTTLNLTANTNLWDIECQDNNISTLFLPATTTLTHINCSNNQLAALNVSANPGLKDLVCENNQIASLNLSNNTDLYALYCGNNSLTNLNTSTNSNLVAIGCQFNQLTEISFPTSISLTNIQCNDNLLTSLHIPANSTLTSLACHNNQLNSLNVSSNTALQGLICYNNQLTSLNIFGDTSLTNIECENNQLEYLDLSSNTSLTRLVCQFNKLISLNISENTLLTTLYCYNNLLNSLNLQNGNNINMGVVATNNPNLNCIQVDDSTYSATNWITYIDPWANFSLVCNTTISGSIKDAEVNFSTGTLNLNNCIGCLVELYQGSTLVDSQTTTGTGKFNFTGLAGNNYKVIATKTIGSLTSKVTNINVDPGDSLLAIKIPCALVSQTRLIIDSLESREFPTSMFYNLSTLNINATGYNETSIQNLTNSALNIQGNNDDIVNSLSRLLIAQTALKEFSNDASVMISESVVSSFDLGESIYNIATISKKIDKIVSRYAIFKKLQRYTLSLGLKTIKFVGVQAIACVEDNTIRANTKAKYEGLMDILIAKAESKNPEEFSEAVAKTFVRDLITSQATPYIYSNVFITATKSNVSQTYAFANSNNYSGSFTDAYAYTIHNSDNNSLVDIGHMRTNNAQTKINNYRTISTLAGEASSLAGIAALATTAFDGGTMVTIAGILSGIQVGFTASALGQGIKRVSGIKSELPFATTNSFLKTNLNGMPFTRQYLTSTNNSLSDAISDYNNHLLSIQSNINNSQRSIAISQFDSLLVLDSLIQIAQINSIAPIYAAAPYANSAITDFDSLYNTTVVNSAGLSMFNRQSLNYCLLGYLLDSTSTNIIDSINANIGRTINSNANMTIDVENMNDSITGVSVPAHIYVTSSTVPKPMLQSETYPVSFTYKNIGTINADNVYAKLTLADGFTTAQDSIYIGTVNTGSTGTVNFNIHSTPYDTISYLGIVFISPNTTSDAMGTALVVRNIVSVKENDALLSQVSIHPNPFTSETTISFSEEQMNSKIKVYDLMGKELKTTIFTGKYFLLEKGSLKQGVYLVKIIDNKNNVVTKRIVIQ